MLLLVLAQRIDSNSLMYCCQAVVAAAIQVARGGGGELGLVEHYTGAGTGFPEGEGG